MKWTVDGADKRTGQDRRIEIEAGSRAEAERAAVKMGILVSEIDQLSASHAIEDLASVVLGTSPSTAPPLDYHTPGRAQAIAPEYPGILKGAELLKQTASTYRGLSVGGYLAAAAGLVAALGGVAKDNRELAVAGAGVMIIAFVTALLLDSRAKMVELSADLALATRDIARNSFYR